MPSYKLKSIFSVIELKIGKHSDYQLSIFEIVAIGQKFIRVRKMKLFVKIKLYGLWGRRLKMLETFNCMAFEPACSKIHSLVVFQLNSIRLGQMTQPFSGLSYSGVNL